MQLLIYTLYFRVTDKPMSKFRSIRFKVHPKIPYTDPTWTVWFSLWFPTPLIYVNASESQQNIKLKACIAIMSFEICTNNKFILKENEAFNKISVIAIYNRLARPAVSTMNHNRQRSKKTSKNCMTKLFLSLTVRWKCIEFFAIFDRSCFQFD